MNGIGRPRKDIKFDNMDFGEYFRELASQSEEMKQEGLRRVNLETTKQNVKKRQKQEKERKWNTTASGST